MLGGVWIAGCAQSSFPKLLENCINVIGGDDKGLTELAVPAMAGEDELILASRQHAVGWISKVVIATHALEIKHAGVKDHRCFRVLAANRRNNRHVPPLPF